MQPQPAAASPTQRAGDEAQALALRHLQAAGLQLVVANVRCRSGEIDLVLREGAVLVFVEVRSRADARFGGAAASVGAAKRRRLIVTARVFLQTRWRGPAPPCRFDVVALDGTELTWLRGAISDTD